MPTLRLDAAERQWLAVTVAADALWPRPELFNALKEELPAPAEAAGGPHFRAVLLRCYLEGEEAGEVVLTLGVSHLWLLDSYLIASDLRAAKLSDGRSLMEFARKVWSLLAEAYRHDIPGPAHVADHDNDAHVAAAEELLRRPSEGD